MTSGTAARDQDPGTGAAPRSAGTLVLSPATVRWQRSRPRTRHPPPARGLVPPARMAQPLGRRLRPARHRGLTSPDQVRTPRPPGQPEPRPPNRNPRTSRRKRQRRENHAPITTAKRKTSAAATSTKVGGSRRRCAASSGRWALVPGSGTGRHRYPAAVRSRATTRGRGPRLEASADSGQGLAVLAWAPQGGG